MPTDLFGTEQSTTDYPFSVQQPGIRERQLTRKVLDFPDAIDLRLWRLVPGKYERATRLKECLDAKVEARDPSGRARILRPAQERDDGYGATLLLIVTGSEVDTWAEAVQDLQDDDHEQPVTEIRDRAESWAISEDEMPTRSGRV